MSDRREKPICLASILRQIEKARFARPVTSASMPSRASSDSMSAVMRRITSPDSRWSVTKRRRMDWRASGLRTAKARSSSSSRIHCIPMRPARGA